MEDGVESETDLHILLKDMFDASEESFQDNNLLAERDRDYVDGNQWTSDERATIERRGQAPIVINRIKSKVDFLLGAERERRSDVRAYPRTINHEMDAQAATEALRYVADNNDFDMVRSDSFEDTIIEGRTCIEIKYNKKTGEIKQQHIEWDRSFYDPYARGKTLSNRTYAGIAVWMDLKDAANKYPDMQDELEASIADANSQMSETYGDKPIARYIDPKRRRVRVIEIYYERKNKVYRSVFSNAGILEEENLSVYMDDLGNTVDPYEFNICYIDREGNPYGIIRNLIDIQDEINKRRSKALHLLSVRQVKLVKGAVDDVKKVREELAKPDGVVEVNDADGIELLNTNDMAQGQFNLLQEAKSEIDSVGANAAMTGKDPRQLSGKALNSRSAGGFIEVAPLFDNLRNFQQRIYRKTWFCIRQFWTEERWIRVTDDEQNIKFVGLNASVQNENGQVVQQNVVSDIDVDIIISDAPNTVTIQQETFETFSEMIRSGVPIPPEALIEMSPLQAKPKSKVLKQMRGEFETEEQKQQFQQQQDMARRSAEADISEKEAKAMDLRAKSEERMANVKIRIATLEQKGVLGLAQIEKDMDIAEIKATTDILKTKPGQD